MYSLLEGAELRNITLEAQHADLCFMVCDLSETIIEELIPALERKDSLLLKAAEKLSEASDILMVDDLTLAMAQTTVEELRAENEALKATIALLYLTL